MSEKETQMARIAADRERIGQLIEEARAKPGNELAVSVLEMSLASLGMQEAIWKGARS